MYLHKLASTGRNYILLEKKKHFYQCEYYINEYQSIHRQCKVVEDITL